MADDRARLYQALRNADAAGDAASAKRLAAYIKSLPEERSAPEEPHTESSQPESHSAGGIGRQLGLTARYGLEGVASGAGAITDPIITAIGGAVRAATGSDWDPKTLASIGRHVADALGLPQPETQAERMVGAAARGLAGGAGGAATAAQLANTTGGAARSVAQQLAAQPAMQAGAGAAAGTGGQAVAESGGGPIAQMVGSLAAGIAAPAAAWLANAAKVAAKGGAPIAPDKQAILDAAQQADIPLMTSDVLPPDTFLGKQAQAVGERIPIVGTGAVRATQQEARQAAVEKLAQQYGTPSYEAIVGSMKGKVGQIKKAAGNVIDATGKKLDEVGPVTPARSVQAIDEAIAKMSDPNVYNPKSASHIQDLSDLKNVLSSGEQTFSNLRQSRTAVRDMLNSVDPAGRSQLPTYAKKLVGNVYGAMKQDMDAFAKSNLTESEVAKLAKANAVYGNEANLLRNSRLKNVLDKGDITPEVVRNLIYSNKPSENRILFDSLGTVGREQVKSALIADAAQKATRGELINPNAFGTEMARHSKQLDVFFNGREGEQLRGLIRALQVTRRAQDAAATPTTTGAIMLPYAAGAAAYADLGKTLAAALTTGGIARLYESAPVRNALLKVAASPKGSAAESRYMRALASSVAASTQQQAANRSAQKQGF